MVHPAVPAQTMGYSLPLMRMVRTVFHVLRERLTIEESFDLISGFPVLIKGLYVDGWKPSREPRRLTSAAEFVDAVMMADRTAADGDFGLADERAMESVKGVVRAIKKYTSIGEVLDVGATLPRDLRDFWLTA